MAGLADAAQAAAVRICSPAPDDEAVHDFRVALRRMRSLVRAARPLYGKKHCRKWEAKLKVFGDATNALRDAEVLAETLAAAELEGEAAAAATRWLAHAASQKDELFAAAVVMLDQSTHGKTLKRIVKRISKTPRKPHTVTAFDALASELALADVHALLPVPEGDVEQLHRLRIRFKRMRYVAEMLHGNWSPDELREPLHAAVGAARLSALEETAKQASKQQKRLGVLHDVDQGLEALATQAVLNEADVGLLRQGLEALRDQLVARALRALEPWARDAATTGATP